MSGGGGAGAAPPVAARDGAEAAAAVARQGYTYVRVTGASMEPTLKDGDVLRIEPVGAPAIGDLVTYADPAGTLVTHRVCGLTRRELSCRGDARAHADPPVLREAVVGRVTAVCGRDARIDGPLVRIRAGLHRARTRGGAAARRLTGGG